MKLTTLLLIVSILQVSAVTFAQKVTLSKKNAPLVEVFSQIKAQTGYDFVFNGSTLKDARPVTIDVKDIELDDVLVKIFANQPLEYTIENKLVVVSKKTKLSISLPGVNAAALIDVRGRVVDEKGLPLVGATVAVKGGKTSTTDKDGNFYLAKVDEKAVLVISFIGYLTKEVNANADLSSIALEVANSKLDEIQVIAYGTTSQRLSTGNVGTVKAADIEKQPVSNPILAIQGRIPGIEIIQATGLPGSGVKVRIRGQNSLNNGNDPFYVVDGVPYSSQLLPNLGSVLGGSEGPDGSVFGSPLSYLNPSDIESIDVLKDADATAIYGSRAANGAILITTKKGKTGETKVNFNLQSGIGQITRKVNLLNTQQYLEMRKEAITNDGLPLPTSQLSNYDLTVYDQNRYTDWQELLIGGTSKYNDAQGSVSGGSANTQFLFGGGYHRETTVFPSDFSDTKGSVHFNINTNSSDHKFKAVFSGSYVTDNNKLLRYDPTTSITLAPNAPAIYNMDGTLNWAPNPVTGFSTWRAGNPLAQENIAYNNSTTNLVSNAVLSYSIMPNLEIKSNFGFTTMHVKEFTGLPLTSIDPAVSALFNPRSADYTNNETYSWIIEPQIIYSFNLGKGRLQALLGATFQKNNNEGEIQHGEGFVTDEVLRDIKSANTTSIISTTFSQYNYAAMFARINYNLSDKYILNLTARRDGSSRFGPENRFHSFGAIGAAWIFSNENFIKNQFAILSYGKIRGSYGITGSDQIGNYRYLDLYYATNYTYQGTKGLIVQNLFNPVLAWEETKKLEVNIDLGFLKDKILLSAAYFKNESSNQLASYSLPGTTGYGAVDANQDAKVQNAGWELVLSTANIKSKSFTWSSSLNFTLPTNKLVSLGPDVLGIDQNKVGKPLGTIFYYRYLGVDPTSGLYLFADKDGNSTTDPDDLDKTVPINMLPKYYGGLLNSFSYHNFQLDFLLQFVHQLGNNNVFGKYPGEFYSDNQPTTVLNRWQKPGDVAKVQRFNQDYQFFNNAGRATSSDASVSDASFIRLKNVSFSYLFPQHILKSIHVQQLKVFIQGQNLLTFTKYKGSDPETRSFNSLPPLRVLTAGIQLGL